MRQQANSCTLVAPCVLACRVGVFWRERISRTEYQFYGEF